MNRSVAIATGMAALTASVALFADQKKVDEKFCEAVASFQTNVAELKAIGPHSTVAELRAATQRVDKDVEDMQKAASKMKTPTAKRFLAATKKLDKDVNTISDDATLQQVHAKIEADVKEARSAGRELAGEAGCPAPASEPQQ